MSQGVAKVKKDKKITWKEIKRQKFLLIVSFFMVVYGIIFYYWPLTGWLMAFQNYKPKDGLLGSKFVGLAKFQFLFQDATFLRVIRNTFCMGVLNLVTSTIMAILFAILLNEIRATKPKKVIQTISYLPHFLSWIIVTGILHDALSSTGIINELLMKAGIIDRAIDFFAHPKYFWWIVAFANCWKETGWNAGFEVQYLLGNGLIKSVSDTIDIYVLTWGISQNDFSLGTAAGIFKSAVSIALILVANFAAKRMGEERLF